MADQKKKYREETKEWLHFFTEKNLETAQNFVNNGGYKVFACNEYMASAYIGQGKQYHPVIRNAPTCYSEDWNEDDFTCTCAAANPRSNWWGVEGLKKTCSHEAALLLLWEKKHGVWHFTETEEEYRERVEEEKRKREEASVSARKKREEKVERNAKELTLENEKPGEKLFFSVPQAIEARKTTLYALHLAEEIVAGEQQRWETMPYITYDSMGQQILGCKTYTGHPYDPASTELKLGQKGLSGRRCSCRSRGYAWGYSHQNDDDPLCGHELATLKRLWGYILEHNPGDATDKAAEQLFSFLDGDVTVEEEEQEKKKEKIRDIVLSPRLLVQQKEVGLTFKIGRSGGKTLILKGFRNLQEAMEEEKEFSLGKNLTLDFARETMTEDSEVWLGYIQTRINDADRVNRRLASQRFGYYGRGVSVQSNEKLAGAALDQFYALAEGMDIEYESKASGRKGVLHLGDVLPKIRLDGTSLKGHDGSIQGVGVKGTVPSVISGQNSRYVVTDAALGRISDAQWETIQPFFRIADDAGYVRFTVGQNRLSEFYYRIVPGMMENPYIDFDDQTGGMVEALLPPQPMFTFRLDCSGGKCIAGCLVAYEDKTYTLSSSSGNRKGEYHDTAQEKRVIACIERFFPHYDGKENIWLTDPSDDAVYAVMTEGVAQMRKLGEIVVTDAFSRRSVHPAPQLRLNISVGVDLLDIELLSKDISVEELSQIYQSYRLRRRYHKLPDGSFVELEDASVFSSVEDVAGKLDIPVEKLLQGGQHVPLYRALYLDQLMQKHEDLSGSRDRTYRSLIKGFSTIKDADYDVPAELENVLRPYQVFGHKWVCTVLEAGFGGILADEMGLGKTVEAISVMQAMQLERKLTPALVVCPASLVYNWEEEIHRFAPGLTCRAVAGTVAIRKKLLSEVGQSNGAQIYITSYDLLRTDVHLYENLSFELMVIDEAQYIKNTKAAMTKAVKVINARKRLALTGTPIENRLAELWSIFDFLMPGFLYDYQEFAHRFEVPITKQKDQEATDRLKMLTGPFILRRKKEDVLKELPPKLEEIRYARLDKKQRSVYDAQVLKMKGMLKSSEGKGEDKIRILAELMHIRQICCDPSLLFENYHGESAKREACIELVQNAIGGGHRMLIFSQFTSMLELLEHDLKEEKIPYYKLTGATPKDQRIRDMHAFNEGDVPVYLISLKAGGTGLNLTGADMVIHYDPWWNLAAQNQATDRAHRIGQKKSVVVYRLIAKDTIEERILALQDAKKDLADAILSGEQQSLMSLSEEELLGLL